MYTSFLFLEYLPINLSSRKKVPGVGRGTVYTKCVYIVPVSVVDSELPFQLKKGYWPCKRNGVYKVCTDRSCYFSICKFSFETEKKLLVLEEE